MTSNRRTLASSFIVCLCMLMPSASNSQGQSPTGVPVVIPILPKPDTRIEIGTMTQRQLLRSFDDIPDERLLKTRSGTIEYIQKAIGQIEAISHIVSNADAFEKSKLTKEQFNNTRLLLMDDILTKAFALRLALVSNEFVRVDSISASVPWGVQFQFKFMEPSSPKP